MIPIDERILEEDAIDRVCDILRQGGIVALPTETVYGLAADALNPAAVRKIFAAKGRPADNPLIVHIAGPDQLRQLAREIPESARMLAARFWPGPLTMVLKKSSAIPDITSAGLDTVGIRMPSHPVMRAIIEKSGLPLAAPSANRSGSPSTTSAQHCIDDLSGRVDAIVLSSDCAVGVESTVISLCGEHPRLLRPGGITREQLEEAIGPIALDEAVLGQAAPESRVSAPGMKYRHYAPKARVQMLIGPSEKFLGYVRAHAGPGAAALCFVGEEQGLPVPAAALGTPEDPAPMAQGLFAALRDFDRKGVQTVYAHCPPPTGVGLAVYNRLIRAAAFDVVEL